MSGIELSGFVRSYGAAISVSTNLTLISPFSCSCDDNSAPFNASIALNYPIALTCSNALKLLTALTIGHLANGKTTIVQMRLASSAKKASYSKETDV